jgi:hypothetical protein
MLLVDSGRFAYVGSDLSGVLRREYQKYARAHNTLTFDGCDQRPLPAVATAPLAPEAVQLARARDTAFASMSHYDSACLKGAVTHTRGVLYERAPGGGDGDFLVVVDAVVTDRARTVEAVWHAHPNATGGIALDAATLVAAVGGATHDFQPTDAQACVVPARSIVSGAAACARASVVVGQVRDDTAGRPWQGWFSATYDAAYAAPAVTYSANATQGTTAFAWLIVPSEKKVSCATHMAEIVGVTHNAIVVTISLNGSSSLNVTVPIGST